MLCEVIRVNSGLTRAAIDEVSIPARTLLDDPNARDNHGNDAHTASLFYSADSPLQHWEKSIKTPEQVNTQAYRYSGVFFVGGHATLFDFPSATSIHHLAVGVYEKGGVIAAVCHGPCVLGSLKLSDGSFLIANKKVTGFSNLGERDHA